MMESLLFACLLPAKNNGVKGGKIDFGGFSVYAISQRDRQTGNQVDQNPPLRSLHFRSNLYTLTLKIESNNPTNHQSHQILKGAVHVTLRSQLETFFVVNCPRITPSQDANGFYDELATKYGIQKDWIEFYEDNYQEPIPQGSSCSSTGIGPPNSPHGPCITIDRWKINLPRVIMSKVVLTNPKVVFTDSKPKMERLQKEIFARRLDLSTNSWLGTVEDIL